MKTGPEGRCCLWVGGKQQAGYGIRQGLYFLLMSNCKDLYNCHMNHLTQDDYQKTWPLFISRFSSFYTYCPNSWYQSTNREVCESHFTSLFTSYTEVFCTGLEPKRNHKFFLKLPTHFQKQFAIRHGGHLARIISFTALWTLALINWSGLISIQH